MEKQLMQSGINERVILIFTDQNIHCSDCLNLKQVHIIFLYISAISFLSVLLYLNTEFPTITQMSRLNMYNNISGF